MELHPEVQNFLFGGLHLWRFGKLFVQNVRLHDWSNIPVIKSRRNTPRQKKIIIIHKMLIPGQTSDKVLTGHELWHSPHGCFETVEFLWGFDYLLVLVGQNPSPKVEPYIPVIMHLLQTALPTEQTAESDSFPRDKVRKQYTTASVSGNSDTIYLQNRLVSPNPIILSAQTSLMLSVYPETLFP